MKNKLTLLATLLILSCSQQTSNLPKEFIGTYEFHIESVHKEIDQMQLSEEENKATKYAFADIENGKLCTVSKSGKLTYPELPPGVYIQLNLISKTNDGYIFSEKNSMNTATTEYSLNTFKNGIWKSVLLNKEFKQSDPTLPRTYWKKK